MIFGQMPEALLFVLRRGGVALPVFEQLFEIGHWKLEKDVGQCSVSTLSFLPGAERSSPDLALLSVVPGIHFLLSRAFAHLVYKELVFPDRNGLVHHVAIESGNGYPLAPFFL